MTFKSTWGETIYKYVSVFLQKGKRKYVFVLKQHYQLAIYTPLKKDGKIVYELKLFLTVIRGLTYYMQSVKNCGPLSPFKEIIRKQKLLFYSCECFLV